MAGTPAFNVSTKSLTAKSQERKHSMGMKRYDVCAPRKRKQRDGTEKTFWVRLGAAFETDRGTQIVLDALPIADNEGRCVMSLFDVKTRGETEPAGTGDRKPGKSTGGGTFEDMDDDIPF
jgi:hypothetical protein